MCFLIFCIVTKIDYFFSIVVKSDSVSSSVKIVCQWISGLIYKSVIDPNYIKI